MKARTKVGIMLYVGIMSVLMFFYARNNSGQEQGSTTRTDSATTRTATDSVIQTAPAKKDSSVSVPARRHDAIFVTRPATVSATLVGPTKVSGDTLKISLDSKGADYCQMSSPVQSGVSPTFSMSFGPEHPWYPKPGAKTTFIVVCSKSGSAPVAANLIVERVSKSQ